jgi:LPXTG-motif cell wall-anchored protein
MKAAMRSRRLLRTTLVVCLALLALPALAAAPAAAAAPGLAATGSDIVPVVIAAGALVAIGATALVVARRRRSR